MIEVTFRIESLDYTDKLDSQLPLVLEALSQSGNINPVLKLACEKLMQKLNEYAAGKGIDVHICDCAATFR